MDKKEIKPERAFWSAFFSGIALVLIMLGILGGGEVFYSSTGLLLIVEMCFGSGMLFGCVFGLMSWIAKRNQKMSEKDDINDLMRQYLEKKLREENEDQP